MEPNYNLCESEQIHLCGHVQSFGFLVILDTDDIVAAISENCVGWLGEDAGYFLEQDFETVFGKFLGESIKNIDNYLRSDIKDIVGREYINLFIKERPFYLSMYHVNEYVYLEFEINQKTLDRKEALYTYFQKIDRSGHYLWDSLCEVLHGILGYDRVMIYQFLEDNSGKVIAEKTRDGMPSYLHLRYPEFDIPKQARELYLKHLCRMTADIHAPVSNIKSKRVDSYDLTYTTIRALSPIHLQYLENAGVKASISFSIIINGKLWGLVTCQNQKPQTVDLDKRYFGQMMVQYAINSHLAMMKEIDLQIHKRYKDFEVLLREKLLIKTNFLLVLANYLQQLMDMVHADGIAIIRKNEVVSFGSTPNKSQVRLLHSYLNEHTDKSLYKNHRFRLLHNYGEEHGGFAGLAKVDVVGSRDFSIIWFRDEYVYVEKWAGNPEKPVKFDEKSNTYYPSPRTSFDVWQESVRGIAVPWTSNELFFMKRVRQIIRESMLRKSDEIKSLNEKLILLNNSLDTYAYTITHDLKNPLSAIKLAGQMLQHRKDPQAEFLEKVSNTVLDSVQMMENLMSKVLEFSRAKIYEFDFEVVDVYPIVRGIVDQNIHTYKVDPQCVEVGELLPVLGEKTLLYQLFLNLISNAIKYSSKTENPQVKIYSRKEGQFIRYDISDNGIGIEPDEIKDIYNMFKRLSNSSSFDGSGVGLSIVKRIADRLGLEIKIESVLNKGSVFSIFFPNDQ